jgi:hypothetical protein
MTTKNLYENSKDSNLLLCIESIEKNTNIGPRIFVIWNIPEKEFLFFSVKRQNVSNSTCLQFFKCLSNSSVKTETIKLDSVKLDTVNNTEPVNLDTVNKTTKLNTDIETIGYRCQDATDLVTFIEFIIGRKTKININLYILSDFEALNETPTYDKFEEFIDKNNKIGSYDNTYIKRDRLVHYCNMLKNVYNIF